MNAPKRYADLTDAQRQDFDRRYGRPSPATVSPATIATFATAAAQGVTQGITPGPNSPLLEQTKPRRFKRGHEDMAHMAVIRWADDPETRARFPDLAYLFHPANGGARDAATAGKLKAMGVRRGVPDLLLPVPRSPYVGCAIELKVWKGSHLPADPSDPTKHRTHASDNQLAWLSHLTNAGWSASVEWGSDAAIAALTRYLTLPPR
jgi:hypothetical protein